MSLADFDYCSTGASDRHVVPAELGSLGFIVSMCVCVGVCVCVCVGVFSILWDSSPLLGKSLVVPYTLSPFKFVGFLNVTH